MKVYINFMFFFQFSFDASGVLLLKSDAFLLIFDFMFWAGLNLKLKSC